MIPHIGAPFTSAARRVALFLLSLTLFVLAPLALPSAWAREVRIATFNIENGVGRFNIHTGTFINEDQAAKYAAISSIVARIDADIIGFQELYPNEEHLNGWLKLASELGYDYQALSEQGDISNHTMRQGFFSRFPILSEHSILSTPHGGAEMTRAPLRVVIDVPDAANPLVLWNTHHRSGSGYGVTFLRYVESKRILADIEAYTAANPNHREFVVLGDFNDDIRTSQLSLPAGVSRSLGVNWFVPLPDLHEEYGLEITGSPGSYWFSLTSPMLYPLFPVDRYALGGGGLLHIPAYMEGTDLPVTRPGSGTQLDYVLLSQALMDSPLGAPQAEVYYSVTDLGGGLPKVGEPLPYDTSEIASDHVPIFVDIFMAPFSTVLPSATFHASGETGGPFDPAFATYTLTETNDFNTYWHVEPDVEWLSPDVDEFWLEPLAPIEVNVFLNAHAEALPPGIHQGAITFWNETTDEWIIREVVLTVHDHLSVFPEGGLASAGTLGGPFDPASRIYTVTNKSGLSIPFTATATENWVTVNPSSWLLHAGEAVAVEVSINANALGLPIGQYADTVVFSNQTSGLTASRPISLDVSGALCDAVDACDLAWTSGGNAAWFYQTDVTFDGVDAAQSGPIGTSQSTWMETVIEGPARVGFHWKVSSRSSHYLRFRINGISQASISGETDWTQRTHDIASGIHTLRWDYATTSLSPQGANAGWVDQVRIHRLTATPTATWTPSGIPGGPFSPATHTYTLTNSGAASVEWTATPGVAWISLDLLDGDLEPGGSQPVVASLNENADTLASGTHAGTIVFTNHTTGDSFTRSVSLTVSDTLVIPASPIWFQGYAGGPFNAFQSFYSLSNSGSSALTWAATHTADWFEAVPSSGIIEPGESQIVDIALTSEAETFAAGLRWASVVFSNATTQLTQSRWVYLFVDEPLALSATAWAPDGPVGGPFAPASNVYVLTNRSSLPQTWTASLSAPWLSLDNAGGTLDGETAANLEVHLNGAADALSAGTHSAHLVISNAAGHTVITQSVFLSVGVAFCEAVGACHLNWTFGGNAPWFYQTEVPYNGGPAAASGTITHNQESWMQTAVTGPGTLQFHWRVSSEANFDYLEFWLNGVRTNRISGEVDWQAQTYELGPGEHILRWRYMKDGSVDRGADRGWVAAITWAPPRTAMGVPISWYQRFGYAPDDGDTWDDLDWQPSASGDPLWRQHLAGLDPTDPDAAFRILDIRQAVGEPAHIEWLGGLHGPSTPYLIQSTPDVQNGTWATIGSQPRADGLNTWTESEPADTLRFFRIQALPDP